MTGMLSARQSGDSRAGSNQSAGPNSASGLLWTIVPSLLIALLLISAFVYLQKRLRQIYLPRTFLGVFNKTQRTVWSGFGGFFKTKDSAALHHHGLDAYLFLRFWRLALMIVGLAWPVTWIILMPVYGTSHGGQQQFDKISFSNIESGQDSNRLYAVSFVSIIVFGVTLLLICRERLLCFKLTLAYENAPINDDLVNRTVLFTDGPGSIDHGAADSHSAHVWPAAPAKDMQKLVDKRTKVVNKLEGAMVKWAKSVTDGSDADPRPRTDLGSPSQNEDHLHDDVEKSSSGRAERPTSRFVSWKLIGRKADVIDWCHEQLSTLNSQISTAQLEYHKMTAASAPACFVEFRTKEGAVRSLDMRGKTLEGSLRARSLGSAPAEIIWKNLGMSKSQRGIRRAVVIVAICLMIIFWGPFTAFVGAISNINYLTNKVPFLSFINSIPSVFLGAITGLLPALLLALLMVLVPHIMRFLFKLAGCVTMGEVELRTQRWYFVFQVIQVFLITTLSSGASAVATTIIQDPTQAVDILAKNLPKASNFYISYLVLIGIALSAKVVFSPGQLIFAWLGKFIDKTPRKQLNRYASVRAVKWGTLYPKFTTLVVIALSYSCISPLILGFATLSFVLLYISSRYLMFYSADTTVVNTHGRAYAMALQQMTTGIYLAELCLIGLMGINTGSSTLGAGPLVLNILLLIVTAVFHAVFNAAMVMLARRTSELVAEVRPETDGEPGNTSGSFDKSLQRVFAGHGGDTGHKETITLKLARFLIRFLRVPVLERFPANFEQHAENYWGDARHDRAFIHPAARDLQPVFWVPSDKAGMFKEEMSKFGGLTDETRDGAWLRKGELCTSWREASTEEQQRTAIRETPLWENVRKY